MQFQLRNSYEQKRIKNKRSLERIARLFNTIEKKGELEKLSFHITKKKGMSV